MEGCAAFTSDDAAGLMKALIGEVQRNPELGDAVRERIVAQRNDHGQRLIERAVERGEIPPPADPELALQMIMGPFVFRSLVTGEPVDDEFADHLCTLALRMLGAADDANPGPAAGPVASPRDRRVPPCLRGVLRSHLRAPRGRRGRSSRHASPTGW